jgi:hypothetical protein
VLITNAEQITPAWLTHILHEEGALPFGQVIGIAHQTNQTFTASVSYLNLTYSEDAPDSAPRDLVLKSGKRRIEVEFYCHIAPDMPDAPIVRCYDAVFDLASQKSHLLFHNYDATHFTLGSADALTTDHFRLIFDTLAIIHAQWWENLRLRQDIVQHGEDVMGFVRSQAQQGFPKFVDALGSRLSITGRECFERLFATWPLPQHVERLNTGRQVTLLHGDTHPWNFLFARETKQDHPFLLDWAVWHVGIGTDDLAYTGLSWLPEHRARIEQDLVRQYHRQLMEHGVANYSWEQCWLDYRYSVVNSLYWPVFHCAFGAPDEIWQRELTGATTAFDNLLCAELWEA